VWPGLAVYSLIFLTALKIQEVLLMEVLGLQETEMEIRETRHLIGENVKAQRDTEMGLKELRHATLAGVPGKRAELQNREAALTILRDEGKRLEELLLAKVQKVAALTRRAARVQSATREFDLTPGQASKVTGETAAEIRKSARQIKKTAAADKAANEGRNWTFNQPGGVPW
jgi:hypothetical protein